MTDNTECNCQQALEQKAEIAELMEDLLLAEEKILRTEEAFKQVFLKAYSPTAPHSSDALKAWLQYAAENL